MPKIEHRIGERLTRRERLAVVLAILASVGVHVLVFSSFGGISFLAEKEKKRERMMVIRRLRDTAPVPTVSAPPVAVPVRPPEPLKVPVPPKKVDTPGGLKAGEEGESGSPGGDAAKGPELSEAMVREAEEAPQSAVVAKLSAEVAPQANNVVSVVTDLPAATFLVGGPVENWGSGTYWVRKGLPPGDYTVTFQPATGLVAPPRQTKTLIDGGQIVFVGKYTRKVEVTVDVDPSDARVAIYRPDSKPIEVSSAGRYFVDNLPPGTYTAVFKEMPGYRTPSPQSRVLSPGGTLSISAKYEDLRGGGGGGRGTGGSGSGPGTGESGSGPGSGTSGSGPGGGGGGQGAGSGGSGGGRGAGRGAGAGEGEGMLDRRVQMVVESYPPTGIKENWQPIPYPEVTIRKSNFQQGWCQVYLILDVDADGEVTKIAVERPRPDERAKFEALIQTVEREVRRWEYDRVKAEVHVDVRFYVE